MNTTPEGTGAGAENNRPETGHQLFSWIRSTGLQRAEDAWVGGVLAALAEKLRWDSALVRGLGIVALILFFSPSLLFYGLAWLLLPDAEGRIHAQQALRGSYPSGFWGGAVVAGLGAINVFTPNVAGPFAILLNLAIIGAVGWVIWLLISNHETRADRHETRSDRSAKPKVQASDSSSETAASPGQRPSPQPDPARPADKPAWYPKEDLRSAPEPTQPPPSAPTRTEREPQEDPAEQEQRRRRRMVTLGLLLLAVPAVGGAAWIATQIGLATTSAVLLGLAAVVILLALMQLTAAFRGKPGRAGLLGTFTALMMLVFLADPITGSSNHAFGNYNTSSSQVNTAFANTTLDLRDLTFSEDDQLDLSAAGSAGIDSDQISSWFEVRNAFGNTDVVVPDGTYVQVDPNSFLANVEIHTTDGQQEQSGISSSSFGSGPDEAAGAVGLNLANAFGNVTVYDETTYNQEEQGITDDVDPADADPADADPADDVEQNR